MNENLYPLIDYADFSKVQICAGTIIKASLNEKAKKPAYALEIDFGSLGIKISSAQITENYHPDNLIGQQVVAVMNFPKKRVAGIASEVLVLAGVSEQEGTVLLQPTQLIANGTRIS